MSPSTLFDKVWDAHVVERFDDDWALLHIDRHLLHDFSGPSALAELRSRGLRVHAPALAFATPDHLVSSATDRTIDTNEFGGAMWAAVRDEADRTGIVTLEIGGGRQGIVHVTGPEQGIVLPGLTVICGDSHTCTNGALGALSFGVGSSQITQALATQVLLQQRPRQMRITIDGALGTMVSAKDLALSIIGRFGTSAGAGFAVEYAGSTIDALDVVGATHLVQPHGRARRQVRDDRPGRHDDRVGDRPPLRAYRRLACCSRRIVARLVQRR